MLSYLSNMLNQKKLDTIDDVVKALGGNRPAAVFWGVSDQQVCNIKKDGKLPRSHQFETDVYLRSKGYKINHEAVFGSSLRLLKQKLDQRRYSESRPEPELTSAA